MNITIESVCTILTSILSIYIALQSFNVSKQALKVSETALKSTTSDVEPILNINFDWENDIITIKHETHDIYKLRYVYFGRIKTHVVMTDDQTKISAVELHDGRTGQSLEAVNPESFSCTEEEAKILNKEMQLNLNEDQPPENSKHIDELKKQIDYKIKKSKNIFYWGVSDCFDYRYIEIYYYDIYGNTRGMYYIYKFEYGFKTWQIHKLSEKQYKEYTNNIKYGWSDKKVLDRLFSEDNFQEFEKTKYYNFADPFPFVQ